MSDTTNIKVDKKKEKVILEKEKVEQGRWTDILIKQDDKWIMIGDHGGATSED